MEELIYGSLRWNWFKEDLFPTIYPFIVGDVKKDVPPELLKPEEPAYQDRHALLPPHYPRPHGMGRQRRNDHESPNPAGKGPKTRRQACLLKEIGQQGRLKHLPLNQGRTICNANSPDKTIKQKTRNIPPNVPQ